MILIGLRVKSGKKMKEGPLSASGYLPADSSATSFKRLDISKVKIDGVSVLKVVSELEETLPEVGVQSVLFTFFMLQTSWSLWWNRLGKNIFSKAPPEPRLGSLKADLRRLERQNVSDRRCQKSSVQPKISKVPGARLFRSHYTSRGVVKDVPNRGRVILTPSYFPA